MIIHSGVKVPTASSGRSAIRRRESDQSPIVSAELIGGIGSFRNATLAASGSHFPGMFSARLKLAPSLRPTDLVDNMDVEDHATERARGAMEPAVHQQQHPQKKESKHWSQSAFGRDQNWRTSGESKQTWIRLDRLSLELATMRAAAATAIQHGHIIEGPDFPA